MCRPAGTVAAVPLFIRLYVRHSLLCLVLWMCIPVLLGVAVLPHVALADPTRGWRVREHQTAEALDAYILAVSEAGLHDEASVNATGAGDGSSSYHRRHRQGS